MNKKGPSPLRQRNINVEDVLTEIPAKETGLNSIYWPIEDKENMKPLLTKSKQPKLANKNSTLMALWLHTESELCPSNSLKALHVGNTSRAKLIKWLIEVSKTFSLDREVFFLSVDILDRYLSVNNSKRPELQLIGISCLFVAAKFESVESCSVTDYAEMTANAFSADDVVAMEIKILSALDWRILIPTPFQWLKLFLQFYSSSDNDFPRYSQYKLIQGSKMLIHVLLDGSYANFPRSMLASAVFVLLMRIVKPLYESHHIYTCYEMVDLMNCIVHVMEIVKPVLPSLSALGHEAFSSRTSGNHHNLQHWDASYVSKPKRFCSAE